MKVKIRLFADLRELFGDNSLEIEVEKKVAEQQIIVKKILKEFLKSAPKVKEAIQEKKQLKDNIKLLLNGEEASLDKRVEDGDELAILPPVSGG